MISLNSKFVDIKAIYKTQIKAKNRQNIPLDSDNIINIVFILSYIIIKK